MAYGALSLQVARALQQEFAGQGFDLLYDHGRQGIDSPLLSGKIRSWSGNAYTLEAVLADLDMALVPHGQDKVYALVAVEETSCKPKVILGDVLTTLLGKGIKFQGRRDLQVGRWTTLIVMARDMRQSGPQRVPYLVAQSKYLRENLLTPNASIGRVVIDTFLDYMQLEEKVRQNMAVALQARGTL